MMSSYSELSIDLERGTFTLSEGRGPGSAPPEKHDAIVEPVQLAGLRETAALALSSGLRSRACVARDRSARRRGIFFLDMPPMDYRPYMTLTVAGREARAPINPGCWSAAANQIRQAAFVAARASTN
jgi:hypothetical protein